MPIAHFAWRKSNISIVILIEDTDPVTRSTGVRRLQYLMHPALGRYDIFPGIWFRLSRGICLTQKSFLPERSAAAKCTVECKNLCRLSRQGMVPKPPSLPEKSVYSGLRTKKRVEHGPKYHANLHRNLG